MANLGGVHWVLGQTNGQSKFLGRRGVGKSWLEVVGPTEVVSKPPQSGGGGQVWTEQGNTLALQLCLEVTGAHTKNPKNISFMGS